jgi:putative transcriptional regulator
MNKPYAELNRGTLLIASPDINSGLYFRAVILLCEHGPTGSIGLLINKLPDFEMPQELVALKEAPNKKIELRTGGPLQGGQLMILHSSHEPSDLTMEICPGAYLGGDIHFLEQAAGNEEGPFIRLCLGYCAWAPGQLEKEFLNNLWFLHPANAKYLFETPSESLWRLILKEMGGKYATYASIPDDLSLN